MQQQQHWNYHHSTVPVLLKKGTFSWSAQSLGCNSKDRILLPYQASLGLDLQLHSLTRMENNPTSKPKKKYSPQHIGEAAFN
jgi:hypothetical protein